MKKTEPKTCFAIIAFFCAAFLAFGCSEQREVVATAREAGNKPVFTDANTTGKLKTKSESPAIKVSGALKYLHRDHFAFVRISVSDIRKNKDLNNVPWSEFESSLAEIVGKENANLDRIKSLWIFLDSEFFKLDDFQACALVLLEYATDVNELELKFIAMNSVEDGETQSKSANAPELSLLEERLLAYGSSPILRKLSARETNSSNIAKRLNQVDSNKSASGIVTLGPIKSALRSVFSLFALQPELQIFSQLPDEIQEIDFSCDLKDSESLFGLELKIENDELRKKITQTISKSISESNGLPVGGAPGMSNLPETIFKAKAPKQMLRLGKEIVEQGLLSISESHQKLKINLMRPDSLNDALAAMIDDYGNQMELNKRVENLRSIGNALEEYESKHSVLPPLNSVASGAELPAQFNWRVGLLPMLGHQEAYDQFDFSKSWDAPENLEVAKQIPSVFLLAGVSGETAIQMVIGDGRIYRKSKLQPSLQDITDRKIWTAIAVEIPSVASKISWIAPVEMAAQTVTTQIGFAQENGILFVAGSFDTRGLKRSSKKIDDVLSISGGEKFSRSDFFKFDD